MRPLLIAVLALVALGHTACASSSPAKRPAPPPTTQAPLPQAPQSPEPVVSSPRSAPPARSSDSAPVSSGTTRAPTQRSPSVSSPSAPPTATPHPSGQSTRAPGTSPSTSGTVRSPSAPTTRTAPPPASGTTTAPVPSTRIAPPSPGTVRSPSAPSPSRTVTVDDDGQIRRPGRQPTVSLEEDPKHRKPVPAREDPRGLQTWRVQDAGIQCFAAPCPTYVAHRKVGTKEAEELQLHELDLSALSDADRKRANAGLTSGQGISLTGRLRTLPKRGPAGDATVLVVEKLGSSR